MDNLPKRNTEEKIIPHSGDLGLEFPVRDFDNTDLTEAYQKHHTDTGGNVIVPDDASALPEQIKPAAEKKSRKRLITLGAFGAGVAIAAGTILGISSGDKGENNAPPEDDPKNTSVIDGNENETIVEAIKDNQIVENDPIITESNREEVVKSFEMSAGLDPDNLSKKITDNINRWASSGATPEYMDLNSENWGTDLPYNEDLDKAIALENAEVYAEVMFGEDWRSSPNLVSFVDSMVKINENSLLRFRLTYVSDKYPALTESGKTATAYTENWSKDTELTDWGSKDHPNDNLSSDIKLAQEAFGDKDIIVMDISSTRTNNAADNHFGNNDDYAAVNGSNVYWHSVVAPLGPDKYVIKYINYNSDKNFTSTY